MSHDGDPETSSHRRRFLKLTGALGVSALAGCSGGDGGDGGDGGAESTPTPRVETVVKTKVKEVEVEKTPEPGFEERAAEWRKETLEKAKEELQGNEAIEWFSNIRSPAIVDKWVQSWNQEYPALEGKINVTQAVSTDLRQRVRRELDANNGEAQSVDILQGPMASIIPKVPFTQLSGIPSYDRLPDSIKQFDDRVGAHGFQPYTPAYNSEMLSNPPESWDDIMDEQFCCQKLNTDFTPNVGRSSVVLLPKGFDWVEQLADTIQPRFVKSGFSVTKEVATGKVPMVMAAVGVHVGRWQSEGLPLEPFPGEDTWVWYPKRVHIPGESQPHPNAAKLFIDHLMRTKNGHLQAARAGVLGTDLETTLKPEWLDFFPGPENINTVPKTLEALGGLSQNEVITRYQEALGAPTV